MQLSGASIEPFMIEDEKNHSKAIGGHARAAALSGEERKAIARRAAALRWSGDLQLADYEGEFNLGDFSIGCAVLTDGSRIITQATFLRTLARARSPKAGTGVLSTVDELPSFLQAEVLKPFISDDLVRSTKPVFYITKSGGRGVGYDAKLLPQVAEVYLRYRDHCLQTSGSLPLRYQGMFAAADRLMRGLANVGIVALVDEATGYDKVRERLALQKILDAYLRKDLAAWAKRFPDEFYQQIFRLRGWEWKGMKINRPQVVAHYTKNLVYERLAPGILKELEERIPKNPSGQKKGRLHQLFTDDVGHPALAQHLHAVTALMKASRSWDEFKRMVDKVFPRKGDNLSFDFVETPKSTPSLPNSAANTAKQSSTSIRGGSNSKLS
jgi:hypothetical protein